MRKLCFLVLFVISFAIQAQIVNIPDANFKALLVNSSATTQSNQVAQGLNGQWIKVDANNDGEIQVSEASQISGILKFCQSCTVSQKIGSLQGIEYFTNLTNLQLTNHQIANIDILNSLTSLITLNLASNLIENFNLTSLNNLSSFQLNNNYVTTFNFPISENLISIGLKNNLLTDINLENYKNLESVDLRDNSLSYLILNGLKSLTSVQIANNPALTNIFFINTISDAPFPINFGLDSNVQFICVDAIDYNNALTAYSFLNSNPIVINNYCEPSFTGFGYNIVSGKIELDIDNDGCDIDDVKMSAIKLKVTNIDNTNTQITYTLDDGMYYFFLENGNYTIEPIFENNYFNLSGNLNLSLNAANPELVINDFCATFNGIHHDVEVNFLITLPQPPGFDNFYRIVFKNKGNQVENGTITLDFDDSISDLVSAIPTFSNQTTNLLLWNYSNLQPFETRIIDLVLNLNGPMETPPLNLGDQVNYLATINTLSTDENLYDNASSIKQILFNSLDPNDKTCSEGTTVGPDMIGQYVHYVIRFENTGTYPAVNVVVKDMIDLTKFDINTLIPLHSSHDFVTRINGNKVEFIFEGINLPFDDANNDGYVAFKIKTKSNLVVGNTFSNNANIYFDYNFPITTNTFTTTIAALKVTDFDFGNHFTLYPNPVKDVLNFQSKDTITINSIEIYNILGQIVLAVPNTVSTVDVSSLQSGNYFVKVNTDLGVSNTKFIKE